MCPNSVAAGTVIDWKDEKKERERELLPSTTSKQQQQKHIIQWDTWAAAVRCTCVKWPFIHSQAAAVAIFCFFYFHTIFYFYLTISFYRIIVRFYTTHTTCTHTNTKSIPNLHTDWNSHTRTREIDRERQCAMLRHAYVSLFVYYVQRMLWRVCVRARLCTTFTHKLPSVLLYGYINMYIV